MQIHPASITKEFCEKATMLATIKRNNPVRGSMDRVFEFGILHNPGLFKVLLEHPFYNDRSNRCAHQRCNQHYNEHG